MFWMTSVTALSEEHSVMRYLYGVGQSGKLTVRGNWVRCPSMCPTRTRPEKKQLSDKKCSNGGTVRRIVQTNRPSKKSTVFDFLGPLYEKSFQTARHPVDRVPSCERFTRKLDTLFKCPMNIRA
jgi:hypothetical protein